MWFIGSLLGSISLVALNTLSKLFKFQTPSEFIIMGVLSLWTTFCFTYAWQVGNGFLKIWFINSGLVALGAFAVNWLFIKEPFKISQFIAILFILIGILWLKIK